MSKLGAKLLSNAKGNNGETVEHKDCNQRHGAADLQDVCDKLRSKFGSISGVGCHVLLLMFSLFSLAVWVETKGCLQPKLDNGFVVGGWVQEWLDPGLSTDNSNTTIGCR